MGGSSSVTSFLHEGGKANPVATEAQWSGQSRLYHTNEKYSSARRNLGVVVCNCCSRWGVQRSLRLFVHLSGRMVSGRQVEWCYGEVAAGAKRLDREKQRQFRQSQRGSSAKGSRRFLR